MLRNILLPIILISSCAMAAEHTDTLLNINKPSSVTITESAEWFNVNVISPDSSKCGNYHETFTTPTKIESKFDLTDISIPTSGNDEWFVCGGGPGIGWVSACGQPSGLGIEMGKSLEISWVNVVGVKYKLPGNAGLISLSAGLDWRNYRISTSQHRFFSADQNSVLIAPYPEGATAHGSRLKVFSIGLPLLYRYTFAARPFGTRINIKAGPIFNINTHASLKTKWTDADGNNVTQRSNHIGQRRFTVDLFSAVDICSGIHLYLRYSPQSVLKSSAGPGFTPFSTGIIIGL